MKALLVIVYVAGGWGASWSDRATFPTMDECLVALSAVQFQRPYENAEGDGFVAYCKPVGEPDDDR